MSNGIEKTTKRIVSENEVPLGIRRVIQKKYNEKSLLQFNIQKAIERFIINNLDFPLDRHELLNPVDGIFKDVKYINRSKVHYLLDVHDKLTVKHDLFYKHSIKEIYAHSYINNIVKKIMDISYFEYSNGELRINYENIRGCTLSYKLYFRGTHYGGGSVSFKGNFLKSKYLYARTWEELKRKKHITIKF